MNLLTKLQLKLYNIDMPQINFADYPGKFNRNIKIINKNSNIVLNDYKKYVKYEDFDYYIAQIYDQDVTLTQEVKMLCDDEFLARTITGTVFYAKMYILFYLRTQKGKDEVCISKAISRLDFLSDNLAFEAIRYFVNTEKIWVEYDKEHMNFNVSDPVKNDNLFKLILEVLNFINHANYAIYEEDEEKLKQIFNSFDFGQLVNDCFDVFGMNDNSSIYKSSKEDENIQKSSENL